MQPSKLMVALLWDCLCGNIRTLFLYRAEDGEWVAGSGSELGTGGAIIGRGSSFGEELVHLKPTWKLRGDNDLGRGAYCVYNHVSSCLFPD